MRFMGFDKNLIHKYVIFWVESESPNEFLTYCEKHVWEKYGSWVMVQKTSRTIRMSNSLNCSYLADRLKHKIEFLYVVRHL